MLRLSKLTDYAVVVLVRLSASATIATSVGIAARTGIPEPTVAKVLKTLGANRLVISQRGAHGGYRLARPLAQIAIAEVIAAIDGPIALTACVDGGNAGCDVLEVCPVRGLWDPVNAAIREALAAISLADMQEAAVARPFRIVSLVRPPLAQNALAHNSLAETGPSASPASAPAVSASSASIAE
ncbi:MAG: SUF system Fe-S cluster assembly regulator [Acetobacteraceae bacterium]